MYVLPANSFNPAVTGTTIESRSWNATANDLAAALTQSLSSDGQTTMTGNLQMGNNKLTGLANGSASTDSITYGQAAKLSGGNTFTGTQTFSDAAVFAGSVSISGPIIFTGTANFDTLGVASTASITTLGVSGVASVKTLNVSGALAVASAASIASLNATALSINGTAFPYEVGSFTPAVTINGSATGVTGTFSGRYTKAGNVVTARIRAILTSNGANTGAAAVTGLPFTAAGGNAMAAVLETIIGFASMTGAPMANVNSGGTVIDLYQASATGRTALSDTNVTDTASFSILVVYEV